MVKHLPLPNSDTSLPPPPNSITIAGGISVSIDDHVYMQPEYIDEPFYIGRVMEFVYVPRVRQPKITASSDKREDTPTPSSTPVTAAQLRARLAWFQRPRDLPVTRVRAKDSRLLVATMHSDLNPVSAIRGKCFVRHITEIADLNTWKSKPDYYYYTQLFDRYSTRLYDMIPVAQIRNAPQDILQKLHDTYEFIFAESQKIADLVNTRRACTVCAKWCSVNESLKCSLCEKHYHMQCLDPPLTKKPAKGYTWQCAACMRRRLEQREKALDDSSSATAGILEPGDRKRTTRSSSSDEFAIALRSSAATGMTTPSGAAAASAAASDTESRSGSKRLKLSHGESRYNGDISGKVIPRPKNRGIWPFRYFGINTDIDDVLHDDERIYPRAVSRIGPKYQAIIPDMVSPSGAELDSRLLAQHARIFEENGDTTDRKPHQLRQKANGNTTSITNGTTSHTGHRGKDNYGGGWSSGGINSGGGGGTTRWHSKSAEQMDIMWDEIEVRRGNHDEQVFFKQPSFLPNNELEMYMGAIVPFLCRHFSSIHDFSLLECQDAALHGLVLHGYDVEEALISIPECPEGYIRQREPGDYWTEEGLEKFNDCMREYGSNLQSIHNNIPENTRRAITLHYYMMRPTNLGKQLLEAYDNRNHSGQRRPNLGQGEGAANIHVEVASDAGLSSSNTPASSPRTTGMTTRDHSRMSNDHHEKQLRCLNCARDRASHWYPAPLELAAHNTRSAKYSGARRVICNDCRGYWLRYAAMPDQEFISSRKYNNQLQQRQQQQQQPAQDSYNLHSRSNGSHEEHRKSSTRPKYAIAGVFPKIKGADHWPLTPCDVCRLPTVSGTGSTQPLLICQDCGVCVHFECSGYPADARLHPKRWRCGICTNINNPTISLNYDCVLCHKGAEVPHPSALTPSDRPRQLMWRTSGNNWVHPVCALALDQSRLLFAHSNVVVDGVMALSKDMWMRRCSVCMQTDGATLKCAESDCREGAHAKCAHILTSDGSDSPQTSRAILVGQIENPAIPPSKVLESIPKFTKSKEKIRAVVKCAKHAHKTDKNISLDAVDEEGNLVMSVVIAAKRATAQMQLRGAMLHARGVKSPRSVASPDSDKMTAAASVNVGGERAEAALKARPRGESPSMLLSSSVGSSSEMGSVQNISANGHPASSDKLVKKPTVAWSSSGDEPSCRRCSTTFSPIWWPSSPGRGLPASSTSSAADLHVMCQRCYNSSGAEGATTGQRSNMASS
ncbi:putative PHD type zinc finger protein with BAH domain-containing protein [Coemansia sp. RSA 1843]|nr:putative PHD type zinc finger protein with BAH domain-containing protein [Coemansia sp. RSA 1843]